MDLDSLSSFIHMAKTVSLTQAAEELFLCPSSLASRIKGLEQEVGQELFLLRGRNLQLSSAGKLFLPYAEKVCLMAEEMEHEILLKEREASGSFSLAATPVVATYILPHILSEFQKRYPYFEVEVHSCPDYQIHDYLLRGIVDVGIVQTGERHESLSYWRWFRDLDVLVVSKNHPWAMKKQILPEDLPSMPMLVFERQSMIWKKQNEWLEREGVTPWISMELKHMETIKEILANGSGYAFLPLQGIHNELNNGLLHRVDLERAPAWDRDTFLVTTAKRSVSDKSQSFVNFSKNEGFHFLPDLREVVL